MSDGQVFYLPGDPRGTKYVEQLWLIAGLLERPTKMYLTATHYGRVIAELRAQHNAPQLTAPDELKFGKTAHTHDATRRTYELAVVNSGTEDEAWVNALNRDTPGAIDFQDKMRRLRVV